MYFKKRMWDIHMYIYICTIYIHTHAQSFLWFKKYLKVSLGRQPFLVPPTGSPGAAMG